MICIESYAQDGHHWTQQFGESSMFLGSSVIGGVSDLGAVYYNPGRISQLEEQVFVFSGNAYEINSLKISDLLGEKGYSSSKFKGIPSITAGTFKINFLKNHYFAWAVLTKSDVDLDISLENDNYGDLFENITGKEYFNSTLNIVNKLRNTWSCISWSHPFTKKLSGGVTAIYSHISSEKSSTLDMAALSEETGNTGVYNYQKGYNFTFNGFLFKAGISYKYKKGFIGLTILSPIERIKSKGGYNNKVYTAGLSDFSSYSDVYGYSNQSGLYALYRSPWAVGLGLSYHLKKNRFLMGMEWYSNVGSYNVLSSNEYEIHSSGEVTSYSVMDNQNAILNFGLGIEIYLSPKVLTYASFCTDYCSVSNKEGNDNVSVLSPLNEDYFNIGGGVKLKFKSTSISLGISHTGAKSNIYRPLEVPSLAYSMADNESNTSIKWDRWRMMFSLSIPLLKSIQKNIEDKIGL